MRGNWLGVTFAMVFVVSACDPASPALTGPEDELQSMALPGSMLAEVATAGRVPVNANQSEVASTPVWLLSSGGISVYGSAVTFMAAGEVAYTNDFEGYGTGFSAPGSPWSIGGVTYTTTSNLIVGTQTFYNPPSTVLCYNSWSPMQGTVDGGFDMFGFDVGILGAVSPVTVTITTNQAVYTFPGSAVPHWTAGGTFFGFVTQHAGEEITGFHLASQQGLGSAPCLDNVMVGTAIITVSVDVKPGSATNPLNLRSRGVVPVAILSSATFDAATVNVSSVAIGSTGVATRGNGTYMASLEDVNGDGLADLVLHFSNEGLVANGDLSASTTELTVTGETASGQRFRGSDGVIIVP